MTIRGCVLVRDCIKSIFPTCNECKCAFDRIQGLNDGEILPPFVFSIMNKFVNQLSNAKNTYLLTLHATQLKIH